MNEQLLRFGASSAFAVGTVCGSLPNIAKLPEPHLRFLARSRLKFRNTTGWVRCPIGAWSGELLKNGNVTDP
jgi:hypothetical protein